jgi:hypothetical protein
MFIICSDVAGNVQNVQNLLRLCSECSDNVLTLLRKCLEFSVNVQNVQNMFRISSQCSECSESVPTFSELLAQKLVYSEFLDFANA